MKSESTTRPFIILKFASSLDGFLDDSSDIRRIFSGAEDDREVQMLRAEVDAVLVGGGTLRKDNPRLSLRDKALQEARVAAGKAPEPQRVLLTRSTDIPSSARMFHEGQGERVIYCLRARTEKIKALGLPVDVREGGSSELELPKILADLKSRGVNSLLVEGGAYVLQTFLAQGFFDRIRAAFAPEFLGPMGGAQIAASKSLNELSLRLLKIRNVGGMSVVDYARS